MKTKFILSILLLSQASHAATVILNNPSFEAQVYADGGYGWVTPTGWTMSSGTMVVENPRASDSYMATDGVNVCSLFYPGSKIEQSTSITVASNMYYEFTIDTQPWHESDGTTAGHIFLAANGVELASVAFSTIPVSGLSVSFDTRNNPDANGYNLSVGVKLDLAPLGGNVVDSSRTFTAVDNARLIATVVPEPSAFALLGLGALGLVARRRR